MRTLLVVLAAAFLAGPVLVACDENEVKVERREHRIEKTDPTPIVVPDSPSK